MEYEALMALISDAGGYGNVVRFIFDNDGHVNFTKKPQEDALKESDFVKLGGTWFYKEPACTRDKVNYEYSIPLAIYHPLDHLQAVVTSTRGTDIDIHSMNDMFIP